MDNAINPHASAIHPQSNASLAWSAAKQVTAESSAQHVTDRMLDTVDRLTKDAAVVRGRLQTTAYRLFGYPKEGVKTFLPGAENQDEPDTLEERFAKRAGALERILADCDELAVSLAKV